MVAGLLTVELLFGCGSEVPPNENGTPTSDAAPTETSQLAPTETPEAAEPAPLEVDSFSFAELQERWEGGCSVLLKRSAEDENYIYLEAPDLALMKIEGGWVEFAHDQGAGFGNPPVRSLTSTDGRYTLNIETVSGDKLGYEVNEIPQATLEIQLEDALPSVVSAVGEIGC